MNIIFLDIDGVMNSVNDRFSTRLENHDYWKRLKRIIDATDAAIVLSSSWRIIERLTFRVNERLQEHGISWVIGTTPYNDNIKGRGNEIKFWLDVAQSSGMNIENFVIIDDEVYDIIDQFPNNIVKTDMYKGLQDEDVLEAIRILNG